MNAPMRPDQEAMHLLGAKACGKCGTPIVVSDPERLMVEDKRSLAFMPICSECSKTTTINITLGGNPWWTGDTSDRT